VAPLLSLAGLHARYGDSHVLRGVSLEIPAGVSLGLLGRNGMGKTTLCNTIAGLKRASGGSIKLAGEEIAGLDPHMIARRGIFPNLSVRENLVMTARPGPAGARDWTFDRVLATFPRLAERLDHGGQQLSGGEQQMLAIGRILRTGARLLLLDEPTEGLAPVIIQQIGRTIRSLKEQGFTILLVEQNFRFASTVADRYYVMEHGRIVEGFANSELDANLEKLHEYLGV